MNPAIDLAEVFARLAGGECSEETAQLGGEGRRDHHDDTAETVIVGSGSFTVEFRDRTLHLSSGQYCVVPTGAEHRGTS